MQRDELFGQNPVMCNFAGLLWGDYFIWRIYGWGTVQEVHLSLERRLEIFCIHIVQRVKTVMFAAGFSLFFAILSIASGKNGCIGM